MPRQKDDADTIRLSAIEEDILTVLLGRELYELEILDQLNPGRPINSKNITNILSYGDRSQTRTRTIYSIPN
jgi:hypothetical protein